MFEQVESAYSRLSGIVHRTPVLTSSTLNRMLGKEVFFKCENLQKIGAFKFRGAYNAISQLTPEQKQQGVIAYSSGNHAQAIACAGKILGVSATIVMPSNAPSVKLQATREYGADVIEYNPKTQTREQVTAEILEQKTLHLIPPFDHRDVIAGQATAAYEFCQDIEKLDLMLAPCGGGGLLSGTAIATKRLQPQCHVFGVEPELADDATLSFYSGQIHSKQNPPTIADGTRTTCLSELTFSLIRQNVDEMVTVSEQAIKEAVKFFFYRMKIVVEPSGALGLAALLENKIDGYHRIGIIVSGGNMDSLTLSQIMV